MNEFLEKISVRERIFLGSGGAALLLVMLYALVLSPFIENLARYEKEVPEKREQLVWMQSAAKELAGRVRIAAGQRKKNGESSPLVVIEKTSRQWQLDTNLKRVEPDGENGVKVWFEEAVFDDLALWLRLLVDEYGLQVASFSADSRDAPGIVDARITFITSAP